MKINNTSVFVGNDSLRADNVEQKNSKAGDRKSIDGRMFSAKQDPIAAKREEAKKKAMQIVGNAFVNELKIDDDLNERRERIKSLQKDIGEANRAVKDLEDGRAALKDVYGITEDSQEEKDLKLLEKEIRYKMPGSDVHFEKGDLERISELKKNGLSEYQQRSLEMLEQETPYIQSVNENKKEIMTENQIITATELERLKTHPMLDAKEQAEAVMETAMKEIIGMMVDEAKDHIDEEAKEQKEKAEAEKEEEEELQARIDAAKEKRKESEKVTEDILEGASEVASVQKDVSSAQQEVKDMMSKMKLIEDDIKGAAVDEAL